MASSVKWDDCVITNISLILYNYCLLLTTYKHCGKRARMSVVAMDYNPGRSTDMVKTVILIIMISTMLKICLCYSAVYSFGDSLTDTGNKLFLDPTVRIRHLPYGETFFGRPSGRFSDGRLVLDYLAEALGKPFIAPYFGNNSIEEGLNFAVAGATGISASFFKARNITIPTAYSLEPQIDLFLSAKKQFCTSCNQDCNVHFERALFFMGEFGGNDYSYATAQNYSLEDLETFIGPLVNTIARSIQRLIEFGRARNIVIQNLPPDGCLPIALSRSKREEKRDKMGCLQKRNEFFKRSNRALLNKLLHLKSLFPHVSFILLDYYKATMTLLTDRAKYGMREDILKACCGVRCKPYNVDPSMLCGLNGTTTCINPNEYFSWDGIHLTDAANGILAQLMFGSIIATNVPKSSSLNAKPKRSF